MFTDLRAMPLIHPTLSIRSMHRVRVNGLQIKTNIRRQTGFMKKQILYCNILLISISQDWQILGRFIRQLQLTRIIKFHHGKQCCSSLRQRSKVEHICRAYSSGVFIRMSTETLIIYRLTIFQHQHLTPWIGSGSQSALDNSIDTMQLIRLHSQIFRNNTSRFHPRSNHTSLTGLIEITDAHGKLSLSRDFSKQYTRYILLNIRFR